MLEGYGNGGFAVTGANSEAQAFFSNGMELAAAFAPSAERRLETLAHVRDAGMAVCCGGILGMGEGQGDRVDMLVTLANLAEHPESVPINLLVPIEGTPLAKVEKLDAIEFVRTIATARIMMPRSFVRLSAGRTGMTDEMQALCFFAGANSIFVGDKLLTTGNPGDDADGALFARLGIAPMPLPSQGHDG